MPTNECRCVTVNCAVHGAAEEMLAMLKEASEDVGVLPGAMRVKIWGVIAKAEGR